MLGLQETGPSTPSTKTYRCVACAATFHGLASLLVHQASHASEFSRQPLLPTCAHCGTLFASKELLDQHHCMSLPPPAASDVYICDCGEEYSDFGAMLEHKRSHETEPQVQPQQFEGTVIELGKEQPGTAMELSKEQPSNADSSHLVPAPLFSNRGLPSCFIKVPPDHSTLSVSEVNTKEWHTIKTIPPEQSTNVPGQGQQVLQKVDLTLSQNILDAQHQTGVEVTSSQGFKNNSLSDRDSRSPKNKTLMKMLASAYMNRRQPAQIKWGHSKRVMPARKVSPRAPTPASKPASTCSPVSSVGQLRQLLTKSRPKKKVSNLSGSVLDISSVKTSSQKSHGIVSMTHTFCPVVVLETRQKLVRYDGLEGRHQCGQCRRVFQDKDSLIMHNALHRKERVKCCRRCQQLVISKASVPDNHICSGSSTATPQHFPSQRNKLPVMTNSISLLKQKVDKTDAHNIKTENQTFMSPTPTEAGKLFKCPLCNRNYARLQSLKRHNCQWLSSLQTTANAAQKDAEKHYKLRSDTELSNPDSAVEEQSAVHISVGVGPEGPRQVKTEVLSAESPAVVKSPIGSKTPLDFGDQSGSPKSFTPFIPKFAKTTIFQPTESISMEYKNTAELNYLAEPVGMGDRDELGTSDNTPGEGGQWTVPLDDAEIDVLIEADDEDHSDKDNEDHSDKDDEDHSDKDDEDHSDQDDEDHSDKDVVLQEPPAEVGARSIVPFKDFHIHISDEGVKRFVCKGCQKSYSRHFTVQQHLKICGAIKSMQQQRSLGTIPHSVIRPRKLFDCFQCGKTFSRKDNMMTHRRRCQAGKSKAELGNGLLEEHDKGSQESMFVLPPPPPPETQTVRQESNNHASGANWGIMSLPSVLPRRVTCECGAVFTCPRLLFGHLQMHAQESYICPHCGENLRSWADYETHQQSHVQPQQQTVVPPGPPQNHSLLSLQQRLHMQPHVQPQPQKSPQQRSLVQSQQQRLPQQRSQQLQDLLRPQQQSSNGSHEEACACHKCNRNFGSRSSLLRHLRLSCRGEVAEPKAQCCSRCGMAFPSTLALKVHMQSNSCAPSSKPIRCPVCVRWFSCVDGLKRHLVTHSQSNVLHCQICQHNYPNLRSLKIHKRRVHGILREGLESPLQDTMEVEKNRLPNVFHCQICQRNYPSLKSLKNHRRKVHRLVGGGLELSKGASAGPVGQSQSNIFNCQICQRNYPSLKSLKNHRRKVHRVVGLGLESSKGASVGLVKQNQSMVFHCHICLRSYPDFQSLKNHKRRVHRILGGAPESSAGITTGLAQHSQSNVFHCQICTRSYPSSQSLKNHRRRVHRILGGGLESSKGTSVGREQQHHSSVFRCPDCQRSYQNLRALNEHRRRAHRILSAVLDLPMEVTMGLSH